MNSSDFENKLLRLSWWVSHYYQFHYCASPRYDSLYIIPRISVHCCRVLPLNASRKVQSSPIVPQCRENGCLIAEVGRS